MTKQEIQERIEEILNEQHFGGDTNNNLKDLLSLISEVVREVIGEPEEECPCLNNDCRVNSMNNLKAEQLSKLEELVK